MKLLRDEREWAFGPSVLALGMFDGVHRGHALLVREAVRLARAEGLAGAALTFDAHPLALLRPRDAPPLLTTAGEKAERMAELGPDALVMRRFDAGFAALSAEAFAERLTLLRPRAAVVGFNYTFGAGGNGSPALLRRLGERYGFAVRVLEPLCWDGAPVSSSRVRAALASGEMEAVRAMLGVAYRVSGTVVRGKRLGRALGFPTANLAPPPDKALPPYGVYAAWALAEGETYPAVLNIGAHPTAPEGGPTVEVHLLDAAPDLYGKRLTASLEAWLRPERKFESLAALGAQIARDAERARDALGLTRLSR